MFTRVTRYFSAGLCALGFLLATGVEAGDRDRHGHRDPGRYDHRHYGGHDRGYVRYSGHEHRNYSSGYAYGYRDARRGYVSYRPVYSSYRPVYVAPYSRYRCNDHRHYGYAHFHVPVSSYRRAYYADYPYHGVYRDRGAEATVILSFPL